MPENSAKEHWADHAANQLISRENKSHYTVASGITPSGIVHIGNFREIITVDLVRRSLIDLGKTVRFIYSWDDCDVFRKVPANIPNPISFEPYLRQSITAIPDPFGCNHTSYADHFEKELEAIVPKVGIRPEYLYQAKQYQASRYADEMRTALRARKTIRDILNQWRAEDHDEKWLPLFVFCEKCGKDDTEVTHYDEEYSITYRCLSCHFIDTFDLRKKGIAKLPWRVDWPMRWFFEKVDYEPAGKDHSSEGGSRTTGNEICKQVYHFDPPQHLMYEFVYAKGQGEKMSKSKGNAITLSTVLEVYEPEIVRYLFASTIPSRSFNISFDADLLKTYEEFDRLERIYFGSEKPTDETELAFLKRVYELSCIEIPPTLPVQIPFRQVTMILQSNAMNVDKTILILSPENASPMDREKIASRVYCAQSWLLQYAPDEFKFVVQTDLSPAAKALPPNLQTLVKALPKLIQDHPKADDLSSALFELPKPQGIPSTEFFKAAYLVLINKERGPKLAGFLLALGHKRVEELIQKLGD